MKRFRPAIMDWENERRSITMPRRSAEARVRIVTSDDHRVVGLHFAGSYSEHNNAVPLWKLRKDLLLTGNGVLFGEE
jgi:hypothetical protein